MPSNAPSPEKPLSPDERLGIFNARLGPNDRKHFNLGAVGSELLRHHSGELRITIFLRGGKNEIAYTYSSAGIFLSRVSRVPVESEIPESDGDGFLRRLKK